MDLVKQTKEAFFKAVDRAGGKLVRLQEKTGVNYSIINRLNSGNNDFKDVSLQTFEKLFPELLVYFFRDEYPGDRPSVDFSHLSKTQRKLLQLIIELDEDGEFDALEALVTIRERRRLTGEVEASKHANSKAG